MFFATHMPAGMRSWLQQEPNSAFERNDADTLESLRTIRTISREKLAASLDDKVLAAAYGSDLIRSRIKSSW